MDIADCSISLTNLSQCHKQCSSHCAVCLGIPQRKRQWTCTCKSGSATAKSGTCQRYQQDAFWRTLAPCMLFNLMVVQYVAVCATCPPFMGKFGYWLLSYPSSCMGCWILSCKGYATFSEEMIPTYVAVTLSATAVPLISMHLVALFGAVSS